VREKEMRHVCKPMWGFLTLRKGWLPAHVGSKWGGVEHKPTSYHSSTITTL